MNPILQAGLSAALLLTAVSCGGFKGSATQPVSTGAASGAGALPDASAQGAAFDPSATDPNGAIAAVQPALPYDGVYPQHEPYGTGIGAMPGARRGISPFTTCPGCSPIT